MTKVKIEQLRAGMIVAADIKNMDDMLLVPAGCELSEKYTERYINIFRTWGITEIMVEANGVETEAAPAAIEVSPEMLEEMKSHFWKLDETSPVHMEILNLITRRRARYSPAA